MKKLMLFAGLLCLQLSLHAAPVSAMERAQESFRENYAWVQDAQWFHDAEENIYCIFLQGSMTNRVFYDKRGAWKLTLISYPPSGLARNVRELVMRRFEKYHISYVNEIRSENNEPVYMINIENANKIKIVRVCGDDILVREDLKKG